MTDFFGASYPIVKDPRGLIHTQKGLNTIKSDLLVLLLTNPGERVMLPAYGTALKTLLFEPNDETIAEQAKRMIIESISTWEPRVVIEDIYVGMIDENDLNPSDTRESQENILSIKIKFFDPENISDLQALVLQVPLAGG